MKKHSFSPTLFTLLPLFALASCGADHTEEEAKIYKKRRKREVAASNERSTSVMRRRLPSDYVVEDSGLGSVAAAPSGSGSGAGGASEPSSSDSSTGSGSSGGSAAPAAPVGDGGTLTGLVVFEGEAPPAGVLDVSPDKSAGCVPGGGDLDRQNRSLLVNASNSGLKNVVIMIEVKGVDLRVPANPVVMDQLECRFEPHVTVTAAGSTIHFTNSDDVSHNVNLSAKKNEDSNKTVPAGGKTTATMPKTDKIRIKCDIHPWMESWLVITDAQFSAITDANGAFTIENLPPGEHRVEYWHEKLGKGKARLSVADDGSFEPLRIAMKRGR